MPHTRKVRVTGKSSNTEIIEARATEDAINNDESLSADQKETLVENLREEEYQLENQRDQKKSHQ